MVTVVQNHYILAKSVLYIQKDFYYPGTRITFFSYLVIIWIVGMKYLRKIFCSLLFLWKKTQTCKYAGGKNIHICICLSVCIYVCMYLLYNIVYLEIPLLCKLRGYTVNLGQMDITRNQGHLMAMWVTVTDQSGNLLLEGSIIKTLFIINAKFRD